MNRTGGVVTTVTSVIPSIPPETVDRYIKEIYPNSFPIILCETLFSSYHLTLPTHPLFFLLLDRYTRLTLTVSSFYQLPLYQSNQPYQPTLTHSLNPTPFFSSFLIDRYTRLTFPVSSFVYKRVKSLLRRRKENTDLALVSLQQQQLQQVTTHNDVIT